MSFLSHAIISPCWISLDSLGFSWILSTANIVADCFFNAALLFVNKSREASQHETMYAYVYV